MVQVFFYKSDALPVTKSTVTKSTI